MESLNCEQIVALMKGKIEKRIAEAMLDIAYMDEFKDLSGKDIKRFMLEAFNELLFKGLPK